MFFIALKKKKGDHILRTYFLFSSCIYINTEFNRIAAKMCKPRPHGGGGVGREGGVRGCGEGEGGGDPCGGKEGITRNAQRT